MDMDVPVIKNLFVKIQQGGMRLDIFQCQHGRLFHYITQIAGQCQTSALTTAQASFHEKYFTTYGSPRQTGHYSCVLITLILITGIFGCPQKFIQVSRFDFGLRKITVRSILACRFTEYLSDFLFQFAHTALTSIILYNGFQRVLRNLDIILFHTVCLQFLRNQMTAGNFNLFFRDIAAYFNQLHTIQQRSGDGIQIVGSSDEHHFGQIIVHVQKVIMKCSVLFRVKHFEEGRGGVSLAVGTHLVYFVQDKYRIGGACLYQILDNPSWHGAHVGLAMTANLGFIMHATQRHTDVLTLQSSSNGTTQRGFSYTRRAIQADDGRFHIALQFQYGQVFQNAFFYFLQTIMVFIQCLFRIGKTQIISCINTPWQTKHRLQIIQLHAVVGRLGMGAFQLIHLF